MFWPIFPAIAIVTAVILNHMANNPDILEDVADAVLVRCALSDMLYERLVDADLNWDQVLAPEAMLQGERECRPETCVI